jgi:hypothetical protein
MATWEYGELIGQAISMNDDGEWVNKIALTWHGPTVDGGTVAGTAVSALNRLGAEGWEVAGVTRNQIEERFQVKVVTTYVMKRMTTR